MKLIRGLHNLKEPLAASAVTLGNFDGIHQGHQHLIEELKQTAAQSGLSSVVLTFEPQPKEFFAGKQTVPRLMRLSEKYLAIKKLGVDYFGVLYFDEELAGLAAEQFVEQILIEKLGMRAIVVGYDFHFGHKRSGNFDLLRKMSAEKNFQALSLPPILSDDEVISSTRLRGELHAGNMSNAAKLLGRHYSLRGKVTYGHQRGRELGFPTANINLHRELVPISGVFVVTAKVDGETYNGVANVGIRPTFHGQRVLLEVHLFDFDRSIYGYNLEVNFLHKLRDEIRYDDFAELVKQIHQDVADAKQYFVTHAVEAIK